MRPARVHRHSAARWRFATLALVVLLNSGCSRASKGPGWSQDFPLTQRGRYFTIHYQRPGWDAAGLARFADGFVELVDRDFLPVRFDRPMDVLVFPDRASFHRYLREVLGADLTPMGIYLPVLSVFATYEDSGLGTFAHEIMHPIVRRFLRDAPRWADEGIPSFFEKFIGYWENERLVAQWGYQNPWRLEVVGGALTRLDLERFAAEKRAPSQLDVAADRLLAVFLWHQGRLERFLQLVAAGDRGGFGTYLEAALERPLAEIVPLWRAYLEDIAANRAAAMRVPPSTVYPDRASYERAMASDQPWLQARQSP
jgi:hypothetical protein